MKTILTIVVLIIAYAITRLVIWNGEMASQAAARGIAVLPFESLSSDKENSFFADGVYDGVSTNLAKVANLKVISHNSVAKYRDARNTQEIGRALNVAYVLKGSVTFTVDGQDEVLKPGDAFYVPPGHLQRAEAGTEYLQFSPAKEMAEVEQQIMKNMQAMQAQEG